jgi:hypothetical protein
MGLRLFSESHETPIVKRKQERQQTFAFDLLALSYLGRRMKSRESRRTLELQAAPATLTDSCRMAVGAFMNQIVTPAERHRGQDRQILALRHELYERARSKYPERRSGRTRNCEPIGTVLLNPDREQQQVKQAA